MKAQILTAKGMLGVIGAKNSVMATTGLERLQTRLAAFVAEEQQKELLTKTLVYSMLMVVYVCFTSRISAQMGM